MELLTNPSFVWLLLLLLPPNISGHTIEEKGESESSLQILRLFPFVFVNHFI